MGNTVMSMNSGRVAFLLWMASLAVMIVSNSTNLMSASLDKSAQQTSLRQGTECNCDNQQSQNSLNELQQEISRLREQIQKLDSNYVVSTPTPPTNVRQFKTEIAKMLTGMWSLNDDKTMIHSSNGNVSVPRFCLNTFITEVVSQLPEQFSGPRCVDWDFNYVTQFEGCKEKFNYQYHAEETAFVLPSGEVNGLIKGDIGGDMTHVPAGVIDLALVTQVFEHVPHFWNAFPNLARMVKEGGVVIFSAPAAYAFHPFPGDYYRYTPASIIHLFESSGFAICHLVSDGWKAFQLHALGLGMNDFDELETIIKRQTKESLLSGASNYNVVVQKVANVGSSCTLPKLKLTNEITRDEVNEFGHHGKFLPEPMEKFPFGVKHWLAN